MQRNRRIVLMSAPNVDSGGPSRWTVSRDPTSSRTNFDERSDKPRSCVICAQRKVRCDKRSPCSRCQRAGIQCVQPSTGHPPRWTRNLLRQSGRDAGAFAAQSAPDGMAVDSVLDRLRHLERLVKDLGGELQEARSTQNTAAASHPGTRQPPAVSSTVSAVDASPAGRIILDESDRVRYVNSGFWSHIDNELDSLKEATRGYERDEDADAFGGAQSRSTSSSHVPEVDRAPLDRHAFLLKYNLSFTSHDPLLLLPMASQIPFLLDVYAERVQLFLCIPHMPTFRKRLQHRQSRRAEQFSPDEEALMFSVYYSAISALDDEEVINSFNVSKAELVLKYRIGLEHALAKADFLNKPSDVLLQALNIFLALARRHESPTFVWTMAGLVLRIAHYLGIHQDGSSSKYISPFQVEMQRRVWWVLCALDMRVTEDQGTELAIPLESYNTRPVSNVNDADIWPDMKHAPMERQGLTDTTFLRLCSGTARSMQEMMAVTATLSVDDQHHRINDLKEKFEREYFNLTDIPQNSVYLAAAGTMRVYLGRMTLLSFPPSLYNSPGKSLPTKIRTKLLVAAIDVAEHNHGLNSDASCQPWRWVYQTQQHWHAVIYILIEICRRPWSSTMERAWVALQSPWLVPVRAPNDENLGVWTPVRRLMARARKHRESEIRRLQADTNTAAKIEAEDRQQIPIPSSSTTFPAYFNPDMFYRRWRQLIYPVTATTTNTFSGASSDTSDDRRKLDLDKSTGTSVDTNNVEEMLPFLHGNQPPFSAPLVSEVPSSIPEPWPAAAMDLADYTNLDTFLGTDTEMDIIDAMHASEALNFDWDSWFELAKGVL